MQERTADLSMRFVNEGLLRQRISMRSGILVAAPEFMRGKECFCAFCVTTVCIGKR